MKKVTSAYANKLLKQLNEEKSYWLQLESECCTYVVANGEEAVIPEYDYQTVAKTIEGLDRKIATIKHAINCYNVTTFLTLEDGQSMTIDQALVVMAQLNRRKQQLDYMRKLQPKQRKENSYMRSNFRGNYGNPDEAGSAQSDDRVWNRNLKRDTTESPVQDFKPKQSGSFGLWLFCPGKVIRYWLSDNV